MTRTSDIESASTGAQRAFEEPFAPGTVLLEDGEFVFLGRTHSQLALSPQLTVIPFSARIATGHGDGHLVFQPQPSEDPNDPLVS
jgi:hypothetical protein